MSIRYALWAGALLFALPWPASGDDPKSDDGYAQVEVRGQVGRFERDPIRRPQDKGLIVTAGRGESRQSFHLDLPTEALRARAEELVGQAVVITGDLAFRELTEDRPKRDPLRVNLIRVKDLRKVDPPKK